MQDVHQLVNELFAAVNCISSGKEETWRLCRYCNVGSLGNVSSSSSFRDDNPVCLEVLFSSWGQGVGAAAALRSVLCGCEGHVQLQS